MLHYVVLPYVCKTFDDLRSAFIHVSSWSAGGELVRSVLVASFYRIGAQKTLAQNHRAGR